MPLRELWLADYRNYDYAHVAFAGPVTVILGANAQGKTNLLEAIRLLSLAQSHRTTQSRQLIRWGRDSARVEGEEGVPPIRLSVILQRQGQKETRINGVPCGSLAEFVGRLNAVLFSAYDVEIIGGEPSRRRRFLNEETSKLYPLHMNRLMAYRRALRHRNRVLRERSHGRSVRDSLAAFSEVLAPLGAEIIHRRWEYVQAIRPLAHQLYMDLSGGSEGLDLDYETFLSLDPVGSREEIQAALANALGKSETGLPETGGPADRCAPTTQAGPHRDDLRLSLGGRDLRRFGSRGEQKGAALALRMAGALHAAQEGEAPPVLLLDDVMGELDPDRRQHLMAALARFDQVILTGTTRADFPAEALYRAHVLRVHAGAVEPDA